MKTKSNHNQNIAVSQITIHDVNHEIDQFWKRYSENNEGITIKRDRKYLSWRFLENPVIPHQLFVSKRNGKITSYVATSITNNEGYAIGNIVDVLMLKGCKDDLHILLEHVIRFLKYKGVIYVRTWFAKNRQSRKYIKMLEKKFLVLPVKTSLHLIVKILNPDLDKQLWINLENWYITMAFSEGVGK